MSFVSLAPYSKVVSCVVYNELNCVCTGIMYMCMGAFDVVILAIIVRKNITAIQKGEFISSQSNQLMVI